MTEVARYQGITIACDPLTPNTHGLCAGCLCDCHDTPPSSSVIVAPKLSQLDRIEAKLDTVIAVVNVLTNTLEQVEPYMDQLGEIVENIKDHPMVKMLTKTKRGR